MTSELKTAPDVAELVRYDLACDFNGKYYPYIIEVELGDYVLHSQAAEIIAADRAEKHRAQEAVLKLERELAQYEAQEPVAWMHPDAGWTDVSRNEVSVHCKHGTAPTPIYASPAPCQDLKAENERLREALTTSQKALNSLVSEDSIKNTTVINAYAMCVDAELKARKALKGES